MKKQDQPFVDPELIQSAKLTVFEPKPKKTYKCRVCDDPGASDESEGLCWVCRRLKISAWREVEVQLPMAE